MTPQLRDLFQRARYDLHLPTGIAHLAVDQPCTALGDWLRDNGHACAAWLTAYNPRGVLRADWLNQTAQQHLESRLAGRYPLLHGAGVDPSGHWPPEPAVLAAGMQSVDALAIARDFGQLALLWCASDAVPRLVETGQAER
jgi:hypothetical protein